MTAAELIAVHDRPDVSGMGCVAYWLDRLRGHGSAHGYDLVRLLADAGHPDAAAASRILRALVEEGRIVPDDAPTPSRLQRFTAAGSYGSAGHRLPWAFSDPAIYRYTRPANRNGR